MSHILQTNLPIGEYRYLYASASSVNSKTKRLFITSNITEETQFITFDVEYDGAIYPFDIWNYAVDFYNNH